MARTPCISIFFQDFFPNMRTMQRSKEEIIKEKLGGAVQVLPNEGLSALEVEVIFHHLLI